MLMLLELLIILITASVNYHVLVKLDGAVVDFWASWGMHHVHNEEWQ